MSGYPLRPPRAAFGPDPKNRNPVRDPERELDGETVGRLMFHQIAGGGLAGARGWFVLDGLAVTPVLLARAEAWNPKQLTNPDFPAPVIARTGVGIYTVSYLAAYKDETGTSTPFDLLGVICAPYNNADDQPRGFLSANNQFTIKHRNSAGTLADGLRSFCAFW